MTKKKPLVPFGGDIVKLILEDHKPLKRLLKIMKSAHKEISERREAFLRFSELLLAHAKPEGQTLYEHMKGDLKLRPEAFEADVEHMLADQLVEQVRLTDDEDLWLARVQVLAELVEHHIKEEEEEILPRFRQKFDREERLLLGQRYLDYRAKYEPIQANKHAYRASLQRVH